MACPSDCISALFLSHFLILSAVELHFNNSSEPSLQFVSDVHIFFAFLSVFVSVFVFVFVFVSMYVLDYLYLYFTSIAF